jgi:hypothetical protein
MSRLGRIRRRPDHWATTHERARTRAAERLDGPLGLAEATWLDEHLASCTECAAVAAAYEDDRRLLRTMRDATPEPPRDLWARTSAAIERESVARGRTPRPATEPRRRVPLGVISGMAVIAVVVGATVLSGGWLGVATPTQSEAPVAAAPAGSPTDATGSAEVAPPTPFVVGAGDVAWVRAGPDGTFYGNAAIERVCPAGGTAGCANVDARQERLDLGLATSPRAIIGSPTDRQAVVVGDDGAGHDQVIVMSLPEPDTETPAPSATATPEMTATPEGSATATPPATEPPTESAAPTGSPDATPEPSPTVVPTPEPTVAAALAIAQGVVVVGESAAFSSDGRWFAFTARPADGSSGPDIWVWRVGSPAAQKLTDDGAHVFASWAGSTVVGSTPASEPSADGDMTPMSQLIDPSSGEATTIDDPLWRPVVDPGESRAVSWTGTIEVSDDGTALSPAAGQLQLRPWTATGEEGAATEVQVLADDAPAVFDVRWDETGDWFALWVAESIDADLGRLSLFRLDPETGVVTQPEGAPDAAAALPGFSIGHGRLAWATPPGQGGEGSRIQIVAWGEDSVGSVESVPGEDLVVVR